MQRLNQTPWYQRGLVWLAFASLVYFPLFLHLGMNPLKAWDEALFALRAYSIAYYGEYLCDFIDLPEGEQTSNLKPPLISLVQAGLYRLIGYGVLALRLPIACMAVGILALWLWLSRYLTGQYQWGFWSGLVLVSMPGFIHEHMARTGDHDVPLAFFNLLLMAGAYFYCEEAPTRRRGVWIMALAWMAGMLTKGSAALFFLPAIAFYFIYRRKLLTLLRDRQAWLALGVVSAVIGAYLLYQEMTCPGYFARAANLEGVGHFTKSRGGHDHPWYFYLVSWWEWKLPMWLPWLIPAAILPWLPSMKAWRHLMVLLWSCLSCGTIVVSLSQTKLMWYDASVLPILAALAGFSIMLLYQGLEKGLQANTFGKQVVVATALALALFAVPYGKVLDKVYLPMDRMYVDERHDFLLRKLDKHFPSEPMFRDFAILQGYRSNHILFYRYLYNQHGDFNIRRYRALHQIHPGDRVMICQPDADDKFRKYFRYHIMMEYKSCYYYEVKGFTEAGLARYRPDSLLQLQALPDSVSVPTDTLP